MKFRNNLKRFFTLDRHHAEGFTLVELIVVIAILAILAGVAVPAYSGYITKTNKQADITLVSDIEYALTLAGYNGTFDDGESGYLILTTEGVKMSNEAGSPVEMVAGSNVEKALIDTFGSNYANVLKLKYAEWANNNLYLSLTEGGAQSILDSTYYGVSDELMGQVKDITDAAYNILNLTGASSTEDMIRLFATDDDPDGTGYMNAIAGMYGFVDEDGNGDVSLVSAAELPNLLVMAVAADVAEAGGGEPAHQVSGLIQNFALYNAYASSEQGKSEGFDTAYNNFLAALDTAGGVSDVADAYNALRATANAATSSFGTYKNGQGKDDAAAFDAMMYGLVGATMDTNADLTKANLADANFFTTGVGNSLFSSYIKSVEAFAGLDFANEDAANAFYEAIGEVGAVGVFFTSYGTYASTSNSLPVA